MWKARYQDRFCRISVRSEDPYVKYRYEEKVRDSWVVRYPEWLEELNAEHDPFKRQDRYWDAVRRFRLRYIEWHNRQPGVIEIET